MRTFVVTLLLSLALLTGFPVSAAKTPKQAVDLNRASLLELMQLPGVGPSRAAAIVQYRSAHPFRRAADLLRIKGIGRRTFKRLRPFVTVEGPAEAPAVTASAPASLKAMPAAVTPATTQAATPKAPASPPQDETAAP
jgi:competence ComEA-like helix-hairpin-helix protein